MMNHTIHVLREDGSNDVQALDVDGPGGGVTKSESCVYDIAREAGVVAVLVRGPDGRLIATVLAPR